jgi:uncharacterized protein
MSNDIASSVASSTEGIRWSGWGEGAFSEAAAAGKPVLLNLMAFWCEWSRRMAATTWADPDVRALVDREFIAVRVDADRDPHVQDRYIVGGCPTTAFLTPTGEVLWTGTFLEPAELLQVASSVLHAWRERRAELELEISRRTRAMEAARGRTGSGGLVRREPADDVLTALRADFDPLNGGFGAAPKFPAPQAIELLYSHAAEDEAWRRIADLTLDGMLAGDLWDATDGAFFRYAMAADWTEPRHEKLLSVNAGMLEAYALAALLRQREDWRVIAQRTVAWVDATLGATDDLWGGSLASAPDYYRADAEARAAMQPPVADPTVFTSANARWIGALALAGARLGEPAWVARAELGMRSLLRLMAAPNGGLFHYRAPGEAPRHEFLLVDTLEAARAALALAQATGQWEWVDTARRLARHMEAEYWAEAGGFNERIRTRDDVGALRFLDCQFEHNGDAARLLLDLAHVTGERHWRALAEGTLARLAGRAGRYGTAAAGFALATDEFFEPPPAVFIAVPDHPNDASRPNDAAPLRAASFALPVPTLRVWTVPAGHASETERFSATDVPLAYVWSRRGRSAPVSAPAQLAAAGASIL